MARPTSRTPKSKPEPAPQLAPAPDSGVPFSTARGDAGPADPRGTKLLQLGARIPVDLHERLAAVSEETGVPMARIVRRAIETEVSRLEQHP